MKSILRGAMSYEEAAQRAEGIKATHHICSFLLVDLDYKSWDEFTVVFREGIDGRVKQWVPAVKTMGLRQRKSKATDHKKIKRERPEGWEVCSKNIILLYINFYSLLLKMSKKYWILLLHLKLKNQLSGKGLFK